MKRFPLLVLTLLGLTASISHTAPVPESPELKAAFQAAGVDGTFVMWDVANDAWIGHDAARAQRRFVPASTFKIPNTLIGLDSGAVKSVDETFAYDGSPRMLPTWEKAMGLREAIQVSNVPVYQELARRIGLERMRAGVAKLGYGNGEIGTIVDRFWLDGPLEISAVEQVEFLRKLALGDLPFSQDAMRAVQEITLLESFDGGELHGKTGWTGSADPQIGWFVGWVKRGDKIYPFALNMTMSGKDELPIRVALAKECLRLLGILPSAQP